MTSKKNLAMVAFEIFMIVVVLIYLYPVLNMVFLSLKDTKESNFFRVVNTL